MDEQVLISKAEAVLLLARADKKRCQGGTFLLRVLSNVATIGRDASSSTIKKENKRMSVKARNLLNSTSSEDFTKGTKNEHPDELKKVWAWIAADAETLTEGKILDRIYRYPMVTVTNEEDEKLRDVDRNLDHDASPEERYRRAGIKLVDGAQVRAPAD